MGIEDEVTLGVESATPQEAKPNRRFGFGFRWWSWFVPPLLYLAGSLYAYSGFVRDPRHTLIGGADGVAYAWYLEAMRQSVLHLHNPFVTAALNAPAGVNLMWNTSLLLLGFLCLPLVILVGPFVAVGILFVLAPSLSATAAYVVFRRITGSVVGSAIGGGLFGFAPYFAGHWGHLNLIFVPLLPVMLLVIWNLAVTQTVSPVRAGVVLGVLVGLQVLISEEILVLALEAGVPLLGWAILVYRTSVTSRVRHAAVGLGTAAAVALVIVAVPLWFQLAGPQALKHGVTSRQERLDVAGLVRPSLLQRFASAADRAANLRFPANGAENTGYLGWPLIALCVVLCGWLIWRRDRFGWWWLPSTATVIALAFGTVVQLNGRTLGPGPWHIYQLVPLLSSTQVIRLSLITTLLVGLLIAYVDAAMPARWRPVTILAVIIALVPLAPGVMPYHHQRVPETPRFFSTSAVRVIPYRATTMVLPVARFPKVDAMVWQIRSHLRFDMVGGYSVFKNGAKSTFFPPLPAAWWVLQDVSRSGVQPSGDAIGQARRSLQSYRVRFVVITGRMANIDAVTAAVARIGSCAPRPVADVRVCQVATVG